jgi:hypothetical protein
VEICTHCHRNARSSARTANAHYSAELESDDENYCAKKRESALIDAAPMKITRIESEWTGGRNIILREQGKVRSERLRDLLATIRGLDGKAKRRVDTLSRRGTQKVPALLKRFGLRGVAARRCKNILDRYVLARSTTKDKTAQGCGLHDCERSEAKRRHRSLTGPSSHWLLIFAFRQTLGNKGVIDPHK